MLLEVNMNDATQPTVVFSQQVKVLVGSWLLPPDREASRGDVGSTWGDNSMCSTLASAKVDVLCRNELLWHSVREHVRVASR